MGLELGRRCIWWSWDLGGGSVEGLANRSLKEDKR